MSNVLLIGSNNGEDEDNITIQNSHCIRTVTLSFLIGCFALGSAIGVYLLITEDFISPPDHNYNIVPNDGWRYEHESQPLVLPARELFVTDTNTKGCFTETECAATVKTFARSEDVSLLETSYNFFVGGDGRLYEGRGWNHHCEEPRVCSNNSISIAFIGSFDVNCPDKKLIQTVIHFLQTAQNNEQLSKCFMTSVNSSSEKPKLCLVHAASDFQALTEKNHC